MNEFENAQREEIRRLHRVSQSKDATIKDVLSTAKVLFGKLCRKEKLTDAEKKFYNDSFKDFEDCIG